MKKKWKIIIILVSIAFIAGIGYALYILYMPERDVRDEKGIEITAVAIFDSFTNNENKANAAFLNKAIQVTGVVTNVKKNQAGQTVVILESGDPVFGVNCTFKEDPGAIQNGSTISFKGICTGFLSDVVINEGILLKK